MQTVALPHGGKRLGVTHGFRLGQPRNDEVAEGGLNYQQQGPPWCGVERENRKKRKEVCVLLGTYLPLFLLLTPNRRFGFTAFKPKP
jgi:hypothetical protein